MAFAAEIKVVSYVAIHELRNAGGVTKRTVINANLVAFPAKLVGRLLFP